MATLRAILCPSQPPPPPPPSLALMGGRPGGPEVRFLVVELLRCVLAHTCSGCRCREGAAAAGVTAALLPLAKEDSEAGACTWGTGRIAVRKDSGMGGGAGGSKAAGSKLQPGAVPTRPF